MSVRSAGAVVKVPRGVWACSPSLDFEDLRLGRHALVIAALAANPRAAWDDWLLAMWEEGPTDPMAILLHRTLPLFVAVRATNVHPVVVLADGTVRSADRELTSAAVKRLATALLAGTVPRNWLRGQRR